jgi:hypothetical protein
MKRHSIILIIAIVSALLALCVFVPWWLAFPLGLLILGTLAYVERIFEIKWPKKLIILFFLLFIIFSSGNIIKSKRSEDANEITKQEISTLSKEKEDLRKDLKQAKENTEASKEQITDLKSELKESKAKLSDLKRKTEPRSLLPDQKTKLTQFLPPPANFQVAAACRLMDKESCHYAEELIGVFRDLKWQIGKTNQTFLDDIQSDVVVAVTEEVQIPIADQIMKALNKVGLRASNEPIRKGGISGVQDNTIYLIVGARKQNP